MLAVVHLPDHTSVVDRAAFQSVEVDIASSRALADHGIRVRGLHVVHGRGATGGLVSFELYIFCCYGMFGLTR